MYIFRQQMYKESSFFFARFHQVIFDLILSPKASLPPVGHELWTWGVGTQPVTQGDGISLQYA